MQHPEKVFFQLNESFSGLLFSLRDFCKSRSTKQILIITENQFENRKICEIFNIQNEFFEFLDYLLPFLEFSLNKSLRINLLNILKFFDTETAWQFEKKILRKGNFNGNIDSLDKYIEKEENKVLKTKFTQIYRQISNIINAIEKKSSGNLLELISHHIKIINDHFRKDFDLRAFNIEIKNKNILNLQQYIQQLKKINPTIQQKNLTINKIIDQEFDLLIFFNINNLQDIKINSQKIIFFSQNTQNFDPELKKLFYRVEKNNPENINSKTTIKIQNSPKKSVKIDYNYWLGKIPENHLFSVDDLLFFFNKPKSFYVHMILKIKKTKTLNQKPNSYDFERLFLAKIENKNIQNNIKQNTEINWLWQKKINKLNQKFQDWSKNFNLQKTDQIIQKINIKKKNILLKIKSTFVEKLDQNHIFFEIKTTTDLNQSNKKKIIENALRQEKIQFKSIKF